MNSIEVMASSGGDWSHDEIHDGLVNEKSMDDRNGIEEAELTATTRAELTND